MPELMPEFMPELMPDNICLRSRSFKNKSRIYSRYIKLLEINDFRTLFYFKQIGQHVFAFKQFGHQFGILKINFGAR